MVARTSLAPCCASRRRSSATRRSGSESDANAHAWSGLMSEGTDTSSLAMFFPYPADPMCNRRPARELRAAGRYRADVTLQRDHGDPGDAPSAPPPLTPVVDPRRPSAAEEARTIAASTNTGTLATLDVHRGPVGVVRHLRPAGRRACAVRIPDGRARPQPRPRPAGELVDRRAQHRSRSPGQRPNNTGGQGRKTRRRRACRSPRRASRCGRRGEVLHRLQRLRDVGAASASGAMGGRVRPDGFGDG